MSEPDKLKRACDAVMQAIPEVLNEVGEEDLLDAAQHILGKKHPTTVALQEAIQQQRHEEQETQRRDEKHGLYPEHEDPAN